MGRNTLRTAAVVTIAALFIGSASAAFAATPAGEVTPPTPIDSPNGSYIVLLDEAPTATYEGGEQGLAPTMPDEGQKLDPQSPEVREYQAHLAERQQAVADEAGVTTNETYQTTLNGFSTQMSPEKAAKLAGSKGVLGVYPDEILHPDAVTSTQFLGLEGDTGVWSDLGGIENAGKGIVVGVLDTGISPENPSFAGDPLGTTAGEEPYVDGNDVVFAKADGNEFRSERVAGEGWAAEDYSTKLIGARYFSTGSAASGNDFSNDYLSPRDGDGHGSHTASTAAGNHDVPTTVQGVDFGPISGVAPAAKIAAYKVCWEGPDALSTDDDGCALSDIVAAIDTAVADGVDVINYSIGGGAATTTLGPDDFSFLNAAAAGVFVAVSAGNSGPGASTADHASPWYTTVAASTIPTYEATVVLPNGFEAKGTSVSVPFGTQVTGPVIYAGDIASGDNAELCLPGTLDATKAAGMIVVCDRGVNARVEKSETVAAAGGIGMILVNVTPGSLDNDFHSVPTVHIQNTYREALLDYVQDTVGATATLVSGNITGVETPTPVIAGFSSRGPILADGSDVIKPDISAPGVAILAATNNAPGDAPTFNFLSGTSMSSPHIAGIAALYLGVHPNASPGEVKSAMMTTAYNLVNDDGTDNVDPFAQGAGHVDPTRFLDAGLLYLNGPTDWKAYLNGAGVADLGVPAIDPSDLNLASIAVGMLSSEQTVTRTVTATKAGSYTASASIPGVEVTVSPSTLTFGAAGEQQSFTVTFSNSSATVEEWATGFLTWSGYDGTTARSPLAVRPVTADAPVSVDGVGITGSVDVTITPGITGELPLNVSGLAPVELLPDPDGRVEGHSGDENSGDEYGEVLWVTEVPEGTNLAQFTLDSSDDEGSDLDLSLYRVVGPDDFRYYETWASATGSADEQITLDDPTPGYYVVIASLFGVTPGMTFDMTTAFVTPVGEGSLTATPNPLQAVQGQDATFTVSWTGLQADTRYLGVVQYADSAVRTLVNVDAGPAAPVVKKAPKITGTPQVGQTLKATPGKWVPKDVTVAYQWLRDGQPIAGATAAKYRVTTGDVGTTLSVRVTATAAGNINPGVAMSNEVFVKYTSRTSISMNRYFGTTSQGYEATVRVSPLGGETATGMVDVWVSGKKYTGTLADGAVTFKLSKQSRGIHLVIAVYGGSDTVESSTGITGFIVLR